jgi:tRNA(Ile)-lysidine synthase
MDRPGAWMTARRGADSAALLVRTTLVRALSDLPADAGILVAVSGGPDSMALARAAAGLARPVAAGIVDHGLQPASGDIAGRAAAACTRLGLEPVLVERVEVDLQSGIGPEAAARAARREALESMADDIGAAAILLAHTRDDQAETVLLRLSRGSGARSLAAMAPVNGRWRRPLLDLPRDVVRSSAAEVDTWDDPHNVDPAYARARVRHAALPALVDALGPGVIDGLARSARLLRDDAEALDLLAVDAAAGITDAAGTLDAAGLLDVPRALRTRILRRAALTAGCPAGALTSAHIDRLDALVSDWHGQGPVDLPGGIAGARTCGRLTLHRVPPVADRRHHNGEE